MPLVCYTIEKLVGRFHTEFTVKSKSAIAVGFRESKNKYCDLRNLISRLFLKKYIFVSVEY